MTTRVSYNSKIFPFFFLQYGLLMPFIIFLGPDVPIIISSLIMMIGAIMYNVKFISIKFIFMVSFMISILVFQLLLFPATIDGTYTLIVAFCTIGISALFIGSLKFDYGKLYSNLVRLGYINFFINFLVPFTPFYSAEQGAQMRFAYAILPSAIILLYHIMRGDKKWYNFIIVGITIVELFVFGSRGAFISIILFFILYVIYGTMSNGKKISFFALGSIPIIFSNFLIESFINIVNSFNITTPAFNRYRNMINKGFAEASSGRDELFIQTWNMAVQNPEIGNGIGFFPSTSNTVFEVRFPHNFFIQIFFEYGFIFGTFIYIFLFGLMFKMYLHKKDIQAMAIFIIVSATVFGRLTVSSSYWGRPEFWLIISFCFIYTASNVNFKKVKKN